MYEINDKELGAIIIVPNPRAKRIIARKKADHFQITVPANFNMKQIHSIIDEMRPRLSKLSGPKKREITEEMRFRTHTFSTAITRSDKLIGQVKMSLKDEVLTLQIPANLDLEEDSSQHIIKKMILQALHHEAKRILIPKTIAFARKHNLQVSDVKISKSVSRWGSCSVRKSINLSMFLMLLPEKYIDYVVLHELAHTVEMNHSPDFWKLLDTLCGEDSKAISRIVRKYKSPEKESLMN